jgi:dihydroorotate dehydrogenase electron transfer subunit
MPSRSNIAFASAAYVAGADKQPYCQPDTPAEELLTDVIANDWVNDEYKHLVLKASPKSLNTKPGQFFNFLCPSPDDGELWLRRPQSVYRIDRAANRLEFLYKCVGRGTRGMATLRPGDDCNLVGPLGVGFSLDPAWKNIVVLGRGVGLATLAPISQFAGDLGIRVTAILSARDPSLAMGADLFAQVGTVIPVLDSDGSSSVDNVQALLVDLIARKKADAFFTCGSNRLLLLMKQLGKQHKIPGQAAMEQIMACGIGPCYVCVKTFEKDGKKDLRRVCIEGPVFNLQECVGW